MFLEVEILVPVTQPGHCLDTATVRQLRLAPAQYHEGFWESGAWFLCAHYTLVSTQWCDGGVHVQYLLRGEQVSPGVYVML